MNGKKLLVADDSLTIQKVIRLALSNEGYEILAVSDGNDTLQQISLSRPDLVLIDVTLPGKSAFEVKKWANEQADLQATRFVLMSSAFEAVDEAQVSTLGFHGRLTKPFDPAHLRKVLTDVLGDPSGEAVAAPSQRTVPPPPPPPPKAPAAVTPPPPPPPLSAKAPAEEPKVRIESSTSTLVVDPLWSDIRPPGGLEPPRLTPSVPSAPVRDDSDIRELTESTIRLSGLDDFDWSLEEKAKKDDPFSIMDEPTLAPPSSNLADLGSSTFNLSPPLDPASSYHSAPEHTPPFSFESTSGGGSSTTEPTFDSAQVETLVQQQVQAALEKLAKQMLPDIAERVIRQEIRRMLSDQLS